MRETEYRLQNKFHLATRRLANHSSKPPHAQDNSVESLPVLLISITVRIRIPHIPLPLRQSSRESRSEIASPTTRYNCSSYDCSSGCSSCDESGCRDAVGSC